MKLKRRFLFFLNAIYLMLSIVLLTEILHSNGGAIDVVELGISAVFFFSSLQILIWRIYTDWTLKRHTSFLEMKIFEKANTAVHLAAVVHIGFGISLLCATLFQSLRYVLLVFLIAALFLWSGWFSLKLHKIGQPI